MYVLLENNRVKEIIPDVDPRFPNVPIGKRYEEKFVKSLMHVDDGAEVKCGMVYDAESGGFSEDNAPRVKFVVAGVPVAPIHERRITELEEALDMILSEVVE